MGEKSKLIEQLPAALISPDRQFPPRTPHTYAHVGQQVLAEVVQLCPDLPEVSKVYQLPAFRNGAAWSGA